MGRRRSADRKALDVEGRLSDMVESFEAWMLTWFYEFEDIRG